MQMIPPENWPDPKIQYLNRLKFKSERVYRSIKRQCRIAKYFNSLSERTEWLGELYANEIKNAQKAHIEIQYVNEEIGYGVFASKNLPAGCFVGMYTGVVCDRFSFYKSPNDYGFAYPQIKFGLNRFYIDASDQGNETRFINHSDHPNCEALNAYYDGILHIIIRTTCEVPADKQLFFYYGYEYWRKRKNPFEIK